MTAPKPSPISTSFTLTLLTETFARLRMVCDAAGVKPEDVHLSDLCPLEAKRLRAQGQRDVWKALET